MKKIAAHLISRAVGLSFHWRIILAGCLGGRRCPSNLLMSRERKGPLIPFTSASPIGLWHFGQIGGDEGFMAQMDRTFSTTMFASVLPRNPSGQHVSY